MLSEFPVTVCWDTSKESGAREIEIVLHSHSVPDTPWQAEKTALPGMTFDSWQRTYISLKFTLLEESLVFIEISVETNMWRVFVEQSEIIEDARDPPTSLHKKKCQATLSFQDSLTNALVSITAISSTFSFPFTERYKSQLNQDINSFYS